MISSPEKLGSLWRSTYVILMSFFLKISEMMLWILSIWFFLSLVNLGQWRKKWFNVSISKQQIQIGLSVPKNLRLNLCSLKWLGPTQRWVRKISSFWWLTLKALLLRGPIKFKIFFLKIKYKRKQPKSEYNLFDSTNADVKKEWKKIFLTLDWRITKFWLFLVWYELFEGIKSNK